MQISSTVGIKEMPEKGGITKEHKEALGHDRYLHNLDYYDGFMSFMRLLF